MSTGDEWEGGWESGEDENFKDTGLEGGVDLLDELAGNSNSIDASFQQSSKTNERDAAKLGQDQSGKNDLLSRIALNPHKAGMTGVDQNKVNEIIYETSKNSRFFKNEQKKAERVHKKTEALLQKLSDLTKSGALTAADVIERVDRHVAQLEAERDLTRVIVHVDMDAFYAAVEMRDNPELRDKPIAVGGMSMLSTANYKAREFGVRSAMPGYIAKKLCPHLLIVPLNFDKYHTVSQQVREILSDYDPEHESVSLDEAYLDITDHINARPDAATITPEEVVDEMRRRVREKTELTISAGIAANCRLAKVCSDINKPNGQYSMPSNRQAILDFVRDLRVRKMGGIGKVTERILAALGITTCGQLYEQRVVLYHLFSPISFNFFMRVALGLGATQREGNWIRKSISHERTFHEMKSLTAMLEMCRGLCDAVAESAQEQSCKGKTITLKLKTVDFELKTRAHTSDRATNQSDDMYTIASALLQTEFAAAAPLKLRLMGVRLSGLQSCEGADRQPGQHTITAFFNPPTDQSNEDIPCCPICSRPIKGDDASMNKHIDDCLSKRAVQEMLQRQEEEGGTNTRTPPRQQNEGKRAGGAQGKRQAKKHQPNGYGTLDRFFSPSQHSKT